MEHIQKDDIYYQKRNFTYFWTATQDILAYPVSFLEMGPDFNGICQRTYFLRSWKVMMQKDVSSMEVFRQY